MYKIISEYQGEEECVICLEQLADSEHKLAKLKCKHVLHQNCIEEWLKNQQTWPNCRQAIDEAPDDSSSVEEEKVIDDAPYDPGSDEEEKVPNQDNNIEFNQMLRVPTRQLPPIRPLAQMRSGAHSRDLIAEYRNLYNRPIDPSRYEID